MTEPSVSGEHAVLCWTGREWELHDLGGAYLDGKAYIEASAPGASIR
jgi:hypothetical protein